jgi:hypothetical protein
MYILMSIEVSQERERNCLFETQYLFGTQMDIAPIVVSIRYRYLKK